MNNNRRNLRQKSKFNRGKILNYILYAGLVIALFVVIGFGKNIYLKLTGNDEKGGRAQSSEVPAGQIVKKDSTIKGVLQKMTFVDAHGDTHRFTLNNNAKSISLDKNLFKKKAGRMTYTDTENFEYRFGIDVSEFQYDIDWKKVKADGVEFAFVRAGYRGYSNGSLVYDKKFLKNLRGAKKAGIDVGIYFFAQAINEKEAIEEANFVLNAIKGMKLKCPIMYDPESILWAKARTDKLKKSQLTKNALAFCETIEDAGYESGVYANLKWEAYKLNMAKLKDTRMWYADYEKKPQTPYDFEYWQYTSQGSIDGISGNVDCNIQVIPIEN